MSASLISILISVLFFVILIAGFLVGMWRGFKRSVVNAVLSIIGAVIAFFITPMITNAMLGIAIPVSGKSVPLREIAVYLIGQNEDMSAMLENNQNLNTLLLNLPGAILSAVMFIVVTISIQSLLYTVYKILARFVFKYKPMQKKHRLLGGAMGFAKTLVITLFAAMPLASLVGTASHFVAPTTTASEVALAEENTGSEGKNAGSTNLVVEIINGLEGSVFVKACGLFGMDDAMFDYYANVKIDGQQIVIREEVENVVEVINIGKEFSAIANNTASVSDVDYAAIKTSLNKLSQSALFKNVVYQTVGDIVVNYQDYAFSANLSEDVTELLDAVANDITKFIGEDKTYADYFTQNLSALIDCVEIIGESGMIDEVLDLEEKGVNNILKTITSEENIDDLKLGVKALFDVDLVRAIIEPAVQKGVEITGLEVDEISVDTSAWTDNDWDENADALVNVIKNYSIVADEIEEGSENADDKKTIMDIVSDPTILVSEGDYDVASITHNLGQMIDNFRAVKLLYNADGNSIIDALLEESDIVLPAADETIYNNDGTIATITNYTQHFDFMAPALVKIKETGLYSQMKNQTSSKQTIKYIANQLSVEGNEDMLAEIILSLYQVKPTKTLIVDALTGGMGELIDTTALTSYDLWKADLEYISAVLKGLNKNVVGHQTTYLDLVLESQFGTLVDALLPTDVDAIFKPVLYGKATAKIEATLLSELSNALKEITKGSAVVSANETSFVDDAQADDQADEFCGIMQKFLTINKLGTTFEEINTALKESQYLSDDLLGQLLNDLRDNAYRNKDVAELNDGVFKTVFIDLINQMKVEYSDEVALLEANPTLLEQQLGVTSLAEENYSKINYITLANLLAESSSVS
ncbi:MAG: CvpA family protein [Clostridia bacterium]|nr:CvpA family protein [Clostridia bacterium]